MFINKLQEEDTLKMDEIYEGRRKFPRVKLDATMMIRTVDGNLTEAKMNNISMDGAQITCDKETAKLILPKSTSIVDKQQPVVNTVFELEVDEKKHKLEIECKIYYVVSLDGKSVAFGLLFEDFDSNQGEVIDQFIMKTMEEYH